MKFWRRRRQRPLFFVNAAFLGLRVRLGKDEAFDLAAYWAEEDAREEAHRGDPPPAK